MRTFRRALVGLALLSLVGCGTDDPVSPGVKLGPPGSAGVYFDRLARVTHKQVAVGESFELHVLAFDLGHRATRSVFEIPACGLEPFVVDEVVVSPEDEGVNETPELSHVFHLQHGAGLSTEGAVHLAMLKVRLVAPAADVTFTLRASGLAPNVNCPADAWYQWRDVVSSGSTCFLPAHGGGATINPTP